MDEGSKQVAMRALKDWLDLSKSVHQVIEGHVDQGVALTDERAATISGVFARLQEQAEKFDNAVDPPTA